MIETYTDFQFMVRDVITIVCVIAIIIVSVIDKGGNRK